MDDGAADENIDGCIAVAVDDALRGRGPTQVLQDQRVAGKESCDLGADGEGADLGRRAVRVAVLRDEIDSLASADAHAGAEGQARIAVEVDLAVAGIVVDLEPGHAAGGYVRHVIRPKPRRCRHPRAHQSACRRR